MTKDEMEAEVIARLRPDEEEKKYILSIAEKIIDTIKEVSNRQSMMVGSVARDTFIRGDQDLDIFIFFDEDTPREILEEEGLRIANSVVNTMGGEGIGKFAEHPYIHALIDGMKVDLVPCYAVPDASMIKSAVDRTPFHTRYIISRIGNLTDDVLLFKQFVKAGGIYGSDLATGGFSGYLCELLVLFYGGFDQVIDAASGEWLPGYKIDIERHGINEFEDPLIVIDPVDPGRNVAASLSLDKMCTFIELAVLYNNKPDKSFFFRKKEVHVSPDEFKCHLHKRGTKLYAITFPTPHYPEDTIVPQLRRSCNSIVNLLEKNEFNVNRADCIMQEDECMIVVEIITDRLPSLKRHTGPPVWNRTNAKKFCDKYLMENCCAGPYIKEGKYVVEIERKYVYARELLFSEELKNIGHGKHIRIALEKGWNVFLDEDCYRKPFCQFLNDFLLKVSSGISIQREWSGDDI